LGWKRHLHRCPDPTVDLHVELESRRLFETVRQRVSVCVAATATLMALCWEEVKMSAAVYWIKTLDRSANIRQRISYK
jgi:hypothetical protein